MTHVRSPRGALGKAAHQGSCSLRGAEAGATEGPRKHSECSPELTEGLLGLGTLALPQACWPRGEPVAPSLAAKGRPRERMLASLQGCLAQGDCTLGQEAFNLHTGSQESQGTSFPFQVLCNPAVCKERTLASEHTKWLLYVWLGTRDNTCRCLPV